MKRRHCLQAITAGATTAVWPASSWGVQPSDLLPIEDFTRHSRFRGLALSPDGKFLAALAPVGGRSNIVMLDLEKRSSTAITSLRDQDVGGLAWVNAHRLVFWLGPDTQVGLGEQRLGQGLFALNRDASDPRTLSSPNPNVANARTFTFRYTQYSGTVLAAIGDTKSNEILVVANDRNMQFPDAYRMDTETGRKTLLTDRKPGDAIIWRGDRKLAVRAAVTTEAKDTRQALFWRATEASEWIEQASWSPYSGKDVHPVGFDADGNLLVSALHDDRYAIWRWNTMTKSLGERLISHPAYDVRGGVIHDPATGALLGVSINAEKPETIWMDEAMARHQAAVDRALPGHANLLSRFAAASQILITSYSDRSPTRWFLFDPAKRSLEEAVASRPWVKPETMAERKFIRYKARDGRIIPAYLTLPPKGTGKNLPLVVLVHGGPYVRGEVWGFEGNAQFLASRGYAVLQSDFRGSQGYGHGHYAAGLKQWGLGMQDDLNDGAQWAVEQGIADPKRLAIAGASYGGYAVMIGLARDPDLWRCGVNWVGVTDLDLLVNASWSDTAGWDGHEHFFATHIGDLKADADRIEKTSPIRQVVRIKRPVMMAYGAGDRRVPIEHATRMQAALSGRGVAMEYVVYQDEGHGFLREANQTDFFRRMEKFLAEHLKA